MNLALGDRMKNYESRNRHSLQARIPVILRVDGRAFHTLLAGAEKPFDHPFMDAMVDTAGYLMPAIQGAKLAYVQSDEASFLVTDFDRIESEPWFGYDQSKIESVLASMFTSMFDRLWSRAWATFDCRAFNIATDEIANYFLWRARDWERNSLGMYCMSFFSHRQLEGKDASARHEMLHSIGKNWATDLAPQERNGTYISRSGVEMFDILPTYSEIASLVDIALAPNDTSDGSEDTSPRQGND